MAAKESNGRCPDCGEWVAIIVRSGMPAEIPPHGCAVRVCEYPDCRVKRLADEMVQAAAGSWHCPVHALLLAAKDLVSLYRVRGDADWTRISEILAEELPRLVSRAEAFLSSRR